MSGTFNELNETNKITTLPSYAFSAIEMLSNNHNGDMKMIDFQDSVIAHDETGSKYTKQSPSINNESSSMFIIKSESALNEDLTNKIEKQNKIEVSWRILVHY